ncbi:MAG: CRISPR-associated helicase Cas3' [Saprospiraceae bacterium]|nr:CRISPR-associated helicase Cas3' [Saprospiraceae bacterium]
MEFLAKPYGVTLREHIDNVMKEGNSIIKAFPFSFEKYKSINEKDLAKRLKGAIRYHDDGKKIVQWQEACKKDYDNYLIWKDKHQGDYKVFSKQNKELVGKYLKKSGVRHEIASLNEHWQHKFSLPVKVAIAAHHSKLSRKHEDRWKNDLPNSNSFEQWKELVNLNGYFRNHHSFKDAVLKHYEYAGVRAYLQLADRRASAIEGNDIIPHFSSFSYKFPEDWNKRNVQRVAEEYSGEELLLLRAPTGAGKTDASLLWASKQIEQGKAERLIIAMPTRFTSNALSISVAENLSSTGLYHSSAWFNKFHKAVKTGEINREIARKEHELARQLLNPVTVCTIDHLLVALSLTREDHHSIVFNLANSCVVIDEADFYDEFTQANILVLLEALKMLKVPVMIMSASLPESSLKMYQTTGYNVTGIKEDVTDNKRIRCEIKERREYEELNDIEDLLNLCIEKGKAIIYANTVAKAISYFNWFKKKGVTPILYHSRFTEPHKKLKEEALLTALGKEAWQTGTANGIAILTQIGEMSVNISADIMITELCPIDRLVQRAGRLCRFDKERIGDLFVLIPKIGNQLYPAPYGNYIPRIGWEAYPSLLKTLEIINCQKYSASDFVDMVNEVYPSFEALSVQSEHNAVLLRKKFVSNWVILPLEQSKEDDTENQEWKSRSILGNESVFVEFPESDDFLYWQDFQEFKVENSIDISSYLIKNGLKNNKLTKKDIKVSGETLMIYIATNAYSFDCGLQMSPDSIDDQFL